MKDKPEQDADLFRQVVADVTPLPSNNRLTPTPKPRRTFVKAVGVNIVADTFSDHAAGDTALTDFFRNGLNRMTLRKLRRGEWPIQDVLDLHGMTNDEARRLLSEFLHHASQQDFRCINVIHGKGWRSEGRDGLLKVNTRHWLTQHPHVLAFCEAPAHAGGGGAVWVLLKSNHAK
ncbi:MAG: Smr/MutS family protein [Sideroxydans sp.]|nr:Smr/MutS family protein [Sideroxydans sp.]